MYDIPPPAAVNSTYLLISQADFDAFLHELAFLQFRISMLASHAPRFDLPSSQPWPRRAQGQGMNPYACPPEWPGRRQPWPRRDFVPQGQGMNPYAYPPGWPGRPGAGAGAAGGGTHGMFATDRTDDGGIFARDSRQNGGLGLGGMGTEPSMPHFGGGGGRQPGGLGGMGMPPSGMPPAYTSQLNPVGRRGKGRSPAPLGEYYGTGPPPSSTDDVYCYRLPMGRSWTPPVRGGPHNTPNVTRAAPVGNVPRRQDGVRRGGRRVRPVRRAEEANVEAGDGGQREVEGHEDEVEGDSKDDDEADV